MRNIFKIRKLKERSKLLVNCSLHGSQVNKEEKGKLDRRRSCGERVGYQRRNSLVILKKNASANLSTSTHGITRGGADDGPGSPPFEFLNFLDEAKRKAQENEDKCERRPSCLKVATQKESISSPYSKSRVSNMSFTTADTGFSDRASNDSGNKYERITLDDPPMMESEDESRKKVQFDDVRVREYEVCLGDNPSTTDGIALELTWEFAENTPVLVNVFERQKGPTRCEMDLKMSYEDRYSLLRRWGVDELELEKAKREFKTKGGTYQKFRTFIKG